MNKRVFTLLTAGLLLGRPAFSVAYTATDLTTKTVISYSENKTVLVNGMSFHLGASGNTLLKATDVLTTGDRKKAISFGDTNGDMTAGVVFIIHNYSSSSFGLWANIGGAAYKIVTNEDGNALTAATGNDLSELSAEFAVSEGRLKFSGLYTVTVPIKEIKNGLKVFSCSEGIDATYLNDYNSNGTALSFDYTTSELIGNLLDRVVPVLFTDEAVAARPSDEDRLTAGIYFVRGDSKKVKAFVSTVNAEAPDNDAILTAAQEITFLALDPPDRYDINGKQDNEGYALYWIRGSVVTANVDSYSNTNLTITAKGVLNKNGKLTLTVDYRKRDQTAAATKVYIAAVKPSVSDTKIYVTSILISGTKYSVIHPQLGKNSYLDASILLKKNVENVVDIYFASSTKGENDEANSQAEYHRCLAIDPADGSSLSIAAYDSVDFTMPVSQWIVSGFNGKYKSTLTNHETDDDLVLHLRPNGAEDGYEVVSAKYNDTGVAIAASKGVATVLALASNASARFSTIATTRTDGCKVFTDTQIAEGFKMTFNGKGTLFGKKAFYTIDNNATKTMKASTREEDLIVLYPERIEGAKDHSTKFLQGVEDYVISTGAFACLSDEGEAVMKADGDTLVIPTYVLRCTEAKGDDAKHLGATTFRDKAADTTIEFAVVKNTVGTYSLVAVSAVTGDKLSYDDSTGSSAKMVSVNTTSMAITYAVNRYQSAGDIGKTYANVRVLDANPFNPSLATKPRHASFDSMLGSINYQLNKNGFNEGILPAESVVFWLDTADNKARTPSFYISKGIEVAEDEEEPAGRMFMFNPAGSLYYFMEGSTQEYTDGKYYLEGSDKSGTKVIFRPAILTGVDTITTTVKGEAAKVVKELNDSKGVKSTDRLDALKFNITFAEGDDEYFISSQRKVKEGDIYRTAYIYALDDMLGLTTNPEKAVIFTLSTEVPAANESIDVKESSIAAVAGNGIVAIQGAAGETAYVRTVLDQIITETILTSDNATIAASAGIAFVTIGNEAVKVAVE